MSQEIRVEINKLQHSVQKILEECNLESAQAEAAAQALIYADARGVRSHGLTRLAHYIQRIRAGGINTHARYQTQQYSKACTVIDADGGFGHYGSMKAVKEACTIAKEFGIGATLMKNAAHCGALSYYMDSALQKGFAAMMFVNCEQTAVPVGGTRAFFGTNPIAFAFPGNRHRILIDMATTEVAFGKVVQARDINEKVPFSWGVDATGKPTDDPQALRFLSPMAAHKGTALAAAVEGLTGLFTGIFGPHIAPMYGEESLHKKRTTAAFLLAIDPGAFGDKTCYLKTTDSMFEELKAIPSVDKKKPVLVPGERGDKIYAQSLKEGVPVCKTARDILQL